MKRNRFFERHFPALTEKIYFFSKKVKKFFRKVIKFLKYYFKKYLKKLNKKRIRIGKEHPELIENFQLTTIYMIACLVLAKYIKNLVFYYPLILKILVPFCNIIGETPIFAFIGEPTYSFIVYTVITNVMYRKKILINYRINIPDKIRFHVTYIMILEILLSVAIEWLVFFFEIDRATGVASEAIILSLLASMGLFVYLIYVYSWIMGLRNTIPTFPSILHFFNLVVDSSLFWNQLIRIDKNKMKKES